MARVTADFGSEGRYVGTQRVSDLFEEELKRLNTKVEGVASGIEFADLANQVFLAEGGQARDVDHD